MKSLAVLLLIAAAFFGGMMIVKPDTCGADCEIMLSTVTASEFKNDSEKDGVTIIDVRTPEEYREGHIAGAVNSDFYETQEFDEYLDSLDKDGEYLIYCRTGNRSGQTLSLMQEKGFTNVSDLSGGIVAWQASNLPLVR